MTDKYEALRKAAQKATRGPWYDVPHPEWAGSPHHITPRRDEDWVQSIGRTTASPRDAAYIAAANPSAILELLAERDKLREALEDLAEAGEDAWGAGRPCVKLARAALNQETPQ